jgi:hypothetical protein
VFLRDNLLQIVLNPYFVTRTSIRGRECTTRVAQFGTFLRLLEFRTIVAENGDNTKKMVYH